MLKNVLGCLLAAGVLLGLAGCESEEARKERLGLVEETSRLRKLTEDVRGVSKEFPAEELGERHDVRLYRFLFEMPEEVQVREVKWKGLDMGQCLTVDGSDMWLLPSVIGRFGVSDLDEGGKTIRELVTLAEAKYGDEDLERFTLEEIKRRRDEAVGRAFMFAGAEDESFEVYRAANGNMALVLLGRTPKGDEYIQQELVSVYLDGALICGQIPASTEEEREAFLKTIMTRTSLCKDETWSKQEWQEKERHKYVRGR